MTEQPSAPLTPAAAVASPGLGAPSGGAAVLAVPGEMQPWTDGPVDQPAAHRGSRPPAGGEALAALVADLLPTGGDVLLLGPHDLDVLAVVADRAEQVVALRRSPSDAMSLADTTLANVRVVSGSLDGFVRETTDRFDVVVALDGLDRLLSTDSPNLDWQARLHLVTSLVAEGGAVMLHQGNDLSVLEMLDERPDMLRHGDDDWFPLHDDTSRPTSLPSLAEALGTAGLDMARAWSTYGDERSWLLVADDAELDRPDGPLVDLAVRATRTTHRPLLADPEEVLRRAARSGQLAALGAGWLVTTGPNRGHAVYALTDAVGSLVVADEAEGAIVPAATQPGTREPARPSSTAETAADIAAQDSASDDSGAKESEAPSTTTTTPAHLADVVVSAETVPMAPLGPGRSVAADLIRHAATEDVPAFRALAASIGSWWLGAEGPGRRAITFDDVFVHGEGTQLGWSFLHWADEPEAATTLAAAWWLLADELVRTHRRHPWPPWVAGPELVSLWLGMCGVAVTDGGDSITITRGRELADALVLHLLGAQLPARDLRTVLADAERAKADLVEARGHIFGLERTIGFRDKQLRTREMRIRELRKKLAKIERIKATRTFRLADKARKVAREPRKTVGGVRRKAVKAAKRVLRRG